MDSLLALFALGTIGFWVVSVISIIITILLIESEHGVGAFWTLLLTIVLMHFANNGGVINWITHNTGTLIFYVIGYFLAGVVWVYIKWYFHLNNLRQKTKEQTDTWGDKEIDIPKVIHYKYDIIRWMTYWPFSMIATILKDPVRLAWEYLYSKIAKSLQTMANNMFAEFKK